MPDDLKLGTAQPKPFQEALHSAYRRSYWGLIPAQIENSLGKR